MTFRNDRLTEEYYNEQGARIFVINDDFQVSSPILRKLLEHRNSEGITKSY